MAITEREFLEELRQIACDFATDHPELLGDFQHFWERFQVEFFMADAHADIAFQGWLVAKSRARQR